MQITYTQTTEELRRRFHPSSSWRQRLKSLWTMTWPIILGGAACIADPGRHFSVTILEVIGIAYVVLLLIIAASWGMQIWIDRENNSTSYIAEISEHEFVLTAMSSAGQSYPWTHFGSIADVGDYFMFTSNKGQHVAVIPKSAFDNNAHAETFLMQSRRYWEAAKQKQQEEMQKAEGSWPPAPCSGA